MKNSKKDFRSVVVVVRDPVGKLESKCDYDFSIPGRLKKKRNTFLISSMLAFVRDIRFPKF